MSSGDVSPLKKVHHKLNQSNRDPKAEDDGVYNSNTWKVEVGNEEFKARLSHMKLRKELRIQPTNKQVWLFPAPL